MARFPLHSLVWLGALLFLALAMGYWLCNYVLFARTLAPLTLF